MGAVWRARNNALDSPVAIKLLRRRLKREANDARLLQEARAAAKLDHPAIVRVFDVGETEQRDPFIVMELLQGESLASMLKTHGRLGPTRAVQILLPIADALAVAHGKKIVHRDLKPDNIFIASLEGQVQPKLVDFGVAKVDKREPGSFVTQAGAILGSPEYMSPEQAVGSDDVDHRSDVWSFCVVLYEALAGALPFNGSNYNALLYAIVETSPPSVQALSAGDAELSSIIERGMDKDPARRWGSMVELGGALAQWLHARGVTEDVCGTSLGAKWLGRFKGEESRGFARATLPSLNGLPESGVRVADGRNDRGRTMPLPMNQADAAPTSLAPRIWKSRRFVTALLGAVLVLGVVTFVLERRSGASHDRAASAPPRPGSIVMNGLPPASSEVTTSLAAGSMPSGSAAPAASAAPHTPLAPAHRKGKTNRSRGSDLISPY
jgi:serine/threonine-protein kinase